MLLVPHTELPFTHDRTEPWSAIETCLTQLMATVRVADPEPARRTGCRTADAVFDLLTDRDYCYLSKSRVAGYREPALACIESAVRRSEPIDFSYDLGAGYHASIRPGTREPSFDVGLGELFVLVQIASFARRVRSVYPPGVRFHIVIDNLCGFLVNDIPVANTEAYCARFRELIALTGTSALVRLIVESEQFSVGDFRGFSTDLAPGGTAVDAKTHDNIARFLGRLCTQDEASARLRRHDEVIPESERLLSGVIRGIHLTQRATPETLCFRSFPGADSRIQCGEVALTMNAKGRIHPFLLTSQNVADYCCRRALFPGILPPVIGEITYAVRFDAENAPAAAAGGSPQGRR